MIELSLMIEGQDGLNWPRRQRLVAAAEEGTFAGLFRSDHYTNPRPPEKDSLEMMVSLAYLADHTRHLHFGPLVAPLSFRAPALLARQAAAIDDSPRWPDGARPGRGLASARARDVRAGPGRRGDAHGPL